MKLNLHVASLDNIAEQYRELYESDPDNVGEYRLQVDGVDGLRNAKRAEKQQRIAVEAHNRELTAKVKELEAAGAAVKPDEQLTTREKFMRDAALRLAGLEGNARAAALAAIEADMLPLIEREVAEHEKGYRTKLDALEKAVRAETIKQQANAVLRDIAAPSCNEALLPHVLKRLSCERDGDEWRTHVVDTDGKRMSMTVDDLKDEFRHTPAFAPLVRGASLTETAAHARKVAAALGELPRVTKAH